MRFLALGFVLPAFLATPAAAQRALVTGQPLSSALAPEAVTLDSLESRYFSGDSKNFRAYVEALIRRIEFQQNPARAPDATHTIDLKENVYFVVFPTSRGVVARTVLYEPHGVEHTIVLPGVSPDGRPLYEISFVGADHDHVNSMYTVERGQSPLADDLSDLISRLIPVAVTGIDIATVAGPDPARRLTVRLARVTIPFKRSSIAIKDRFSGPRKDSNGKDVVLTFTSDTKWQNIPKTYIGVSVMSGALFRDRGDIPATQKGDNLAKDQLGTATALGAVHLYPVGYRSESSLSFLERLSIFAGGVIAPKPGLAGGIGIRVLPKALLAGGVSWMVVDTVEDESQFGSPPPNPEDPYVRGARTALFVTFGFPI